MQDDDIGNLQAAIAALEAQRAKLGDTVLELAVAPLRTRLASLLRPAGLQHRHVAVLFADVVGSTAMAQGLEAEDMMDVLGGALHRMADIVQAHQGRVLRFTGDGVKAAFGMDEAREDDAERAVRAGLAMLEAVREHAAQARRLHGVEDFTVRVGVHTGDVALGAGIDADNTAVGAAVNIAARMEQSAPPGALRISHDTWNHVRGLFEVEPQPPLQVKGVDAPMQTYLVRAALDRHVAGVERGLRGVSTPMVGRHDELQRLRHAVARANDTGQLQALTLVGDAGLGKSRLLRELLAALSAEPTGCQVLAIRSQPDGMLRPWGLLRSLLAVQCGVADTDSAEVARRKVEAGLAPWFDERGERQAQLIGQLSGLDFGDTPHVRGLDPRSLRDQAFAALRGYLQALVARSHAPTLLVTEDLHWADDGSLDLLQDLVANAAELPLTLIMTGRPVLQVRRPDWGTPDTLVPLTPLAAAQSDELTQALLQRIEEAPSALIDLIVGRAEGNPYYMEELVRRLIDDGVIVVGEPHWTVRTERLQTVRLPGTLVGLLQARLDALPASERLAARQASVIGHVFWDDALQALDPNATQALP
ncbi:MAG: AAA family ATPase, partial [Chitinophagaceae bacterium]|nr:AAA family ATPase [Rubrivivax sp.]